MQQLIQIEKKCERALIEGNVEEANLICAKFNSYISVVSGKINFYDTRSYFSSYNRTLLLLFLNHPLTHLNFHLPPLFSSSLSSVCSSLTVLPSLSSDIMTTTSSLLMEALNLGIRIVLWSGSMDLRDGTMGTEEVIKEIWKKKDEKEKEEKGESIETKRKKKSCGQHKMSLGNEEIRLFFCLYLRDRFPRFSRCPGTLIPNVRHIP